MEEKKDLSLQKWRKRISSVLWIAAILAMLAEVGVYFFLKEDIVAGRVENSITLEAYRWWFIYIPSFCNLLAVTVNSLIQRFAHSEKLKNYSMTVCTLMLCFVVGVTHYVAPLISAVYVVSIYMTVLFGDRKMTRIISGSALLLMAVNLLRSATNTKVELYYINVIAALILFLVSYLLTEALIDYIQASRHSVELSYMQRVQADENAKRDSLTNLYNQKVFLESITSGIERSRYAKEPLCVGMLDLDNFKRVNDTFGHAAGNDVLVKLSELMYQVKEENTRGEVQLFRFGGEEFGMIFHNYTAQQAFEQMEFLRIRFSQVRYRALGDYQVTLSAGIVELHGEADADKIFQGADHALYRAKQNGKNQTAVGEL